MLCVLTGWEVLLASQSAGPGVAESRLSRAKRWVFPALRGDRDRDLDMFNGDLLCLSLPLRILLRFWVGFLWGDEVLALLERFLFLLINGLWKQKSENLKEIYSVNRKWTTHPWSSVTVVSSCCSSRHTIYWFDSVNVFISDMMQFDLLHFEPHNIMFTKGLLG